MDLGRPVTGDNNTYGLFCAPEQGATAWQDQSDVITVRRASVSPVVPENGRLQIQSTRIQGRLFYDGTIPGEFEEPAIPASPALPTDPSATHNLVVNSYYVAKESELIPGVPALRMKTLTVNGGAADIEDVEVAPGVENIQLQLGIDINQDNTVDRYVNPGDGIYDPNAVGYVPGARVLTARVWLVVRSTSQEQGVHDVNDYKPGDADLGVYNDSYRRLQVSKTILLRNSRT